jgi:putative ABC transport system substrate-binding protein
MVNVADPVRSGLVATLRQPGGNVTGMAMLGPELAFKQLEVMKEVAPQATTLAVMFDPQNSAQLELLADNVPVAARAASLQLHPIEVAATTPLDAAFVEIRRKRVDVLLVLPLSRPYGWDREAADLAIKYRLPAFGVFPIHAEHGLLLSSGPSAKEQFQRAATYINRILRGAMPRDLPIEQPTQFQLVVNLKTAKALGLTIPQSILLRADRVFE